MRAMQILKSPYEAFHTPPVHFGALLRWLRDRHGRSQTDVVKHLPSTISQRRYSSFELDQRATRFDELSAIYLTLYRTGVQFTLRDRQLFLLLAKQKLENKITHKVALPEAEWDNLRLELARIDQLPDNVSPVAQASSARSVTLQRMETSHLVGREAWLASTFESVSPRHSTKVIIAQ